MEENAKEKFSSLTKIKMRARIFDGHDVNETNKYIIVYIYTQIHTNIVLYCMSLDFISTKTFIYTWKRKMKC